MFWILFSGTLVFFMQAGFAVLEMGAVRCKNSQNILLKNVLDICIATATWYFVGYGLAYGDSYKGFVGTNQFSGIDVYTFYYRDWFFQYAFAGTATTIISGCLAERCYLSSYVYISIWTTGLVYPVVVHWTWSADGWLLLEDYRDFAGSGIVHMVGGCSGIVGAYILGPRLGRFDDNTKEKDWMPSNIGFVTLGVMILWFGWYGFNGGSTLGMAGATETAGLVYMNTSLSAGFAGLTAFLIETYYYEVESVPVLCNGILAGLVGVTASCNAIYPYAAVIIGVISGIIYLLSIKTVLYFHIDDPLEAFSIHGVCGAWGVLASGIFNFEAGLAYGYTSVMRGSVIGVVCITGWSMGMSYICFKSLQLCNNFRVPNWVENRGLDEVYHGSMGEDARSAIPILSLTRLDDLLKNKIYQNQDKVFVLCIDEDTDVVEKSTLGMMSMTVVEGGRTDTQNQNNFYKQLDVIKDEDEDEEENYEDEKEKERKKREKFEQEIQGFIGTVYD